MRLCRMVVAIAALCSLLSGCLISTVPDVVPETATTELFGSYSVLKAVLYDRVHRTWYYDTTTDDIGVELTNRYPSEYRKIDGDRTFYVKKIIDGIYLLQSDEKNVCEGGNCIDGFVYAVAMTDNFDGTDGLRIIKLDGGNLDDQDCSGSAFNIGLPLELTKMGSYCYLGDVSKLDDAIRTFAAAQSNADAPQDRAGEKYVFDRREN